MSGITDKPTVQSPQTKLRGGPDARLAVLLSSNTIANTQYLRERQTAFDEKFDGNAWSAPYQLVLDPGFSLAWIAHSLRQRFGTVMLVPDANAAINGRFDGIAVVDVFFEPYDKGIPESTAHVTVAFYDAQFRYIGAAGGKEYKAATGFCCWAYSEVVALARTHQKTIANALQDFDTRLPYLVETSPGGVPKPRNNAVGATR